MLLLIELETLIWSPKTRARIDNDGPTRRYSSSGSRDLERNTGLRGYARTDPIAVRLYRGRRHSRRVFAPISVGAARAGDWLARPRAGCRLSRCACCLTSSYRLTSQPNSAVMLWTP